MEMDNMAFGEPVELVTFSIPVLGVNTTRTPFGEKLVIASYFDPSFIIADVDPSGEIPNVTLDRVVSNELSASYDGGEPRVLWGAGAPGHSAPRAGTGMISSDGKWLLYLQNGGTELGRYDLKGKTVFPAMGTLEERGEDFTPLADGRIATIENYTECVLRTYNVVDRKLMLDESIPLNGDMLYGVSQVGKDVVFLAPAISSLEQGLHRLSGRVNLDLPGDARGVAPAHNKDGTVKGLFVATYDFRRDTISQGTPSKLLYVPIEN